MPSTWISFQTASMQLFPPVFSARSRTRAGIERGKGVLKKDGVALFLEHMRPEGGVLGKFFDKLNPLTVRFMGVNINRRTVENIKTAGFDIVEERMLFRIYSDSSRPSLCDGSTAAKKEVSRGECHRVPRDSLYRYLPCQGCMAMKRYDTAVRLCAIIGGIIGVSLLHYFTPLSKPVLHDIYQRLYYIPIILAAFWFDLKGGIGTAMIVSILFVPHIFFQWGGHHGMDTAGQYLEILIYNSVGGVTGFLSQQERRRQRQLVQAARGLEESYHTLQQQSATIIHMEEQLRRSERLSALGELAAVLAHEIRNPLGSIKGTAEILKDDYREGDKKYEFLEILLKESDRLNRVVEDFLRLSRPQPMMFVTCDLGEELRSVVMLVMAEAADRGLSLGLHADESLLIRGDRDKLHQAFLNIILNGIQSTPADGSLNIHAWRQEHDLKDRSEVRIDFQDTGAGIPEDLRKRIFEPFFTTKQEGTGLGLAIAKRIIDAHGGRIEVSSAPSTGTIFTVFLPAGLSTHIRYAAG